LHPAEERCGSGGKAVQEEVEEEGVAEDEEEAFC